MRNILKGRLALIVLVSVLLVLSSVSAVVYATDISLNEIATQHDFHLSTSPVVAFNLNHNTSDESTITGNLFTFTHTIDEFHGVSDSGHVVYWSSSNTATSDRNGRISGSFVIDKRWDGPEDQIFVSFTARSKYVPPLFEELPTPNYNFRGSFRITGGTGFYEGIRGSGTIAGTFQDHEYGGFANAIEFVMMGKAFAR